jgi:hypothetical protein
MDAVSWRAVNETDASFAAPMRHDLILIHDREVGVLIPAQLAMAVYRFTKNTPGRKRDRYGNTVLYVETKRIVERMGPAAELVNIEYVAKTKNAPRPKLPALKVDKEDVTLKDTRKAGKRPRLGGEERQTGNPYIPNAGQRAKLSEYSALVESGVSPTEAHKQVYGKTTKEEVTKAREEASRRRLLAE